jgi:hypothetical protein
LLCTGTYQRPISCLNGGHGSVGARHLSSTKGNKFQRRSPCASSLARCCS